MIEVVQNLFVGSQDDELALRGQTGWYVVHACKEPYHRQALGYTGRAAPKNHPEYLVAVRPGRLILNLIDADTVAYVPPQVIDSAVAAIHANINNLKVLLHCNLGLSRSPTIALLYMAKHTSRFGGMDSATAMDEFRRIYPRYAPAPGMSEYVRLNWAKYVAQT